MRHGLVQVEAWWRQPPQHCAAIALSQTTGPATGINRRPLPHGEGPGTKMDGGLRHSSKSDQARLIPLLRTGASQTVKVAFHERCRGIAAGRGSGAALRAKPQLRTETPLPPRPVRGESPGPAGCARSQHVEQQEQDQGQRSGEQQRAEAAEPVREEEEHRRSMPWPAVANPGGTAMRPTFGRAHPFRGCRWHTPITYGHQRLGRLAGPTVHAVRTPKLPACAVLRVRGRRPRPG